MESNLIEYSNDLNLSAHLTGQWAEEVLLSANSDVSESSWREISGFRLVEKLITKGFKVFQLNLSTPQTFRPQRGQTADQI